MDEKGFEDALSLYLTFEKNFKGERLKSYGEQLGVEDRHGQPKRIFEY